MQSLLAGDNDIALAAGVNLILAASTTAAICQLSALSPAGRCRTFDAAADGYGRGEGVSVALLGTHTDHSPSAAYAVIQGSAVNQDGRSSGLTAPNGPAQTALIRTAMQKAHVGPAEVALVSLHGTGTPLGDPIEVGALSQALAAKSASGHAHHMAWPQALVSSKSCYGHTEGVAGLTGMLMAACSMQASSVAPVMHLREVNPHVAAALSEWRNHQGNSPVVPVQHAGGFTLPLAVFPPLSSSRQWQHVQVLQQSIYASDGTLYLSHIVPMSYQEYARPIQCKSFYLYWLTVLMLVCSLAHWFAQQYVSWHQLLWHERRECPHAAGQPSGHSQGKPYQQAAHLAAMAPSQTLYCANAKPSAAVHNWHTLPAPAVFQLQAAHTCSGSSVQHARGWASSASTLCAAQHGSGSIRKPAG